MKKHGLSNWYAQVRRCFPLRSGSVFGSIFLILLLLTAGVLVLFFHYVLQTYQAQYRYAVIQRNFSRMEYQADRLNLEIGQLLEQVNGLTHRQDCSRLMVMSDITQSVLSMDVAMYLSSMVQNYDTLDEIWIYFNQSDMILSATQDLLPRTESSYQQLLQTYLEKKELGSLVQVGQGSLLSEKGMLYVAVEYPRASPLITIVLELNPETLLARITENRTNESENIPPIYVYSLYGDPLFDMQTNYPDRKALQIRGTAERMWGEKCYAYSSAVSSSDLILLYWAPGTGLLQMLEVDGRTLVPTYRGWIPKVAPYAFLAICLMLAASLYLFRRIYLPLRQVMDSLAENRECEKIAALRRQGNNELDLVQSMVEDDRRQREIMQSMLVQVQESVREKLILSLFCDEGLDENTLMELSATGTCPLLSGPYGVIYLEWRCGGAERSETILCGVRLSQLTEAICTKWARAYHVNVSSIQIAWLICLPSDSTKAEFERQVQRLRHRLDQESKVLGCRCMLGASGLSQDLSGVKQLYERARREAQRWGYYRSDVAQSPNGTAEDQERITQALQHTISRADYPEIDWDGIVSELIQHDSSGNGKELGMLLDLFMEQMIQHQIDPEESWYQMRQTLGDPTDRLTEYDPRVAQIKMLIHLSIDKLRAKTQSRQYQHIIRAKEYLAEHFGDAGLSLELVSEQIGTTGPYLSHLFSSHLSCGFLDYLNHYRISQAQKLLNATNLTVAEIGLKCGFNSPQNFIRVFKKYTGQTPGQYRGSRGDGQL